MNSQRKSKKGIGAVLRLIGMVFLFFVLAGCSSDDGDDGRAGIDGVDGKDGQDAVLTGTISGSLLDAQGLPVVGASVSTMPATKTATTDANGAFTLADIPLGSYEVIAQSSAGTVSLIAGVAGGGVTSLNMALSGQEGGTATITGKVKNTVDVALLGAIVSVEGQNITATTAADGSFTLTGVPAGFVYLNVQAPSDAYLDGGNRKALLAKGGETLADVQITLSGRPSESATYVGMATCKVCHQLNWPEIVNAYDGSPHAAIHSRFVTEGTSHLAYKNLWPAPGAKLLPRDPAGNLLKVQDPRNGKGGGAAGVADRVHVVLCTDDAANPTLDDFYTPVGGSDREFLFKFYPSGFSTADENLLDCSYDAASVWIPIAATIGGEGNWGEGYDDPDHVKPDRHPNFGEGKQRYMCRIEDVPYIKNWMADHGVDRSGQQQDYVAYMPVFIMQDGTPATDDNGNPNPVLAPGELGFPNFWQKSPDAWCGPYNTLSRNCAGCHSTGLKIETQNFGPGYNEIVTYWEYKDLNVTCERCHGPGSEHFAAGKGLDLTKLIMPQYLTHQAAAETCGQCHGNHDGRSITPAGIYKPAYDGNYKNSLGNGFFVPGLYSLETFFANFDKATTTLAPDWQVGSFHTWPDQTHSRPHSQEYLELRRSVHYNNSYEKLVCFDCHDAHTLDGGPASLEVDGYNFVNATYANNTLCLTCHATHGPFANVSTADVAALQLDAGRSVTKDGVAVVVAGPDAALARNQVAKAVAEHMQVKAGMGGALYTPTDANMPVGSCTSCHMAKIGKLQDINVDAMYHLDFDKAGLSAVAEGNVPSHVFDIVWPGQSSILKNPDPSIGKDYDIMPNSCGKCHDFARISGDLD